MIFLIILLLVVILIGFGLIIFLKSNNKLRIWYWLIRKCCPKKLQNKSPKEKPGMVLVFEETFNEISWNETGDSDNWKVGGSNLYHPSRLNVWYGEPELRDGGYGAFTARYNPREIYVYQLDKVIEFPYEVSKLFSYNLFEQQYGRFECRMTLPYAKWSWPAFWLWGAPWPPEIDIIEAYGRETGDDVVYQEINLHWGERDNPQQMGAWKIKIDKPKNIGNNFYEFAVEWRKDRIDFFTNGIRVFTFNDVDILEEWFSQPMWVVINNSIRHAGVDELGVDYYSEFLVDYIRVYKFLD